MSKIALGEYQKKRILRKNYSVNDQWAPVILINTYLVAQSQ